MHPLLSRRLGVPLWLAAWACAAPLAAAPLGGDACALALALPVSLALGLATLPLYAVCQAFPLRPARLAQGAVVHAIVGGAWLTAGAVLAAALAAALELAGACGPRAAGELGGLGDRLAAHAGVLLAQGLLLYGVTLMQHYVVISFRQARTLAQREAALALRGREAALRGLEAQLQPHFLFNALNAVNALVGQDPAAARAVLVALADFLRLSLRVGRLPEILLEEELALVRLYLDIERVRLGERLSCTVQAEAAAAACRVPPLLLLPLVENAITHGVAPRLTGGHVQVAAALQEGRLQVEVSNPVDAAAPSGGGGLGLGQRNVAGRLQLLYGPGGQLTRHLGASFYRVCLTLPGRRGR